METFVVSSDLAVDANSFLPEDIKYHLAFQVIEKIERRRKRGYIYRDKDGCPLRDVRDIVTVLLREGWEKI